MKSLLIMFIAFLFFYQPLSAQDSLYYKDYKPDSLLKAMELELENRLERKNVKIDSIRSIQDSIKKLTKRQTLMVTPDNVVPPKSPEDFNKAFHFPPIPQHYTGTCWSFSTTSYFESEIYRLHGEKIKLSELFTVYYEYLEKAKRFINRYGDSYIAEGSEAEALLDIWKKYGIAPLEAYSGLKKDKKLHDHRLLIDELAAYLDYVEENDLWSWETAEKQIKAILDKHIGTPPAHFKYKGEEYTPKTFLEKAAGLDMDDYAAIISTTKYPFGEKALLDVPDNWRRSEEYLNLPLDDFYNIIVESIKEGYTISIGGDVSEPGYDGYADMAFVCQWDVPPGHINQYSREYRIDNETTTDDHGIHLCGHVEIDGWDWFLIKDSSRSARKGKHKGYLFYRGDYVRLKMLSYLVHKDRVKGHLPH